MRIKEFVTTKLLTRQNFPWKTLIGIVAGAALGYAYYHFVGCASGACPITSSPWSSMIYGSVIGALLSRV